MATYTGTGPGSCTVLPGAGRGPGTFGILATRTGSAQGFWRAANDALARYELYRGMDAPADLDGSPWETFASLPHDSAALAASHVYHFVTRLRNAYNLVSRNITETVIGVDAGGLQVAVAPSAPIDLTLTPDAGGTVRARASYHYNPDGSNQATRFLIYLWLNGTGPDLAVVVMGKADGVAKLNWLSPAFEHGATIQVLIKVRRIDAGPVNVDSTNVTVLTATASTAGPAAPAGHAVFGEYSQE